MAVILRKGCWHTYAHIYTQQQQHTTLSGKWSGHFLPFLESFKFKWDCRNYCFDINRWGAERILRDTPGATRSMLAAAYAHSTFCHRNTHTYASMCVWSEFLSWLHMRVVVVVVCAFDVCRWVSSEIFIFSKRHAVSHPLKWQVEFSTQFIFKFIIMSLEYAACWVLCFFLNFWIL